MAAPVRHPPRPGTRLDPSPELIELKDWAIREGISFPKLDYPVRFDPGYTGSQALEEIGPNEAIVTVPKRLLFMASLVDESELGVIVREHPELFTSDQNSWYEDYRLIAYMLFERKKGRDSFWYHFLATLPKSVDTVLLWTEEELGELQDPLLVEDAKERLKEVRHCWKMFRETMLQYPTFFTEDMLTFQDFIWAQQIVSSRGFGKSVPSTSMCPVAEFLNHDNTQTYYCYGPTSVLQPKNSPEDDADDPPHSSEKVNPLSYYMLALMLKITQKVDNGTYNEMTMTAQKLDNDRYDRMQASAWKPMEFNVTDEYVFRIMTGPTETYSQGAEIYLNYGADSNRHLLIYYGFSLPVNWYNYEYVMVPTEEVLCTPTQLTYARTLEVKSKVCFKVREREVCMQLVRTMRTLRWKYFKHSLPACFLPADLSLETEALQASLTLLRNALGRYPTTAEQDAELQAAATNIRLVFALEYRRQRKFAIVTQVALLESLLEVISLVQSGSSLEAAYSILDPRRHDPLNLTYTAMLQPYLSELTSVTRQ